MVYIKVKERNRNKFITTLTGLEKHSIDIINNIGLDLKEV